MAKNIILNESMFKRLLKEAQGDYLDYLQKNNEEHKDWYDSHRGEDGHFDCESIARECLELLRNGEIKGNKDVFTQHNELISLKNDCKFRLQRHDVEEGNYDLWEIWVPSGEAFDGMDVNEDLDLEIQEELAKHTVE